MDLLFIGAIIAFWAPSSAMAIGATNCDVHHVIVNSSFITTAAIVQVIRCSSQGRADSAVCCTGDFYGTLASVLIDLD